MSPYSFEVLVFNSNSWNDMVKILNHRVKNSVSTFVSKINIFFRTNSIKLEVAGGGASCNRQTALKPHRDNHVG